MREARKETCLTLSALLVAVVAVGSVPAGERHDPGGAAPHDARFEFLKELAGTWVAAAPEEGAADTLFEFRLTAGGHAIEEREMIGTPMEMLTVYHVEGRDLVGTHYCMLGNRPTVKAARKVVDGQLDFDCNGVPGGAASHDEQHVHHWSMRIDDEGRLHYSAKLLDEGKTEEHSMVLTRR